ncbi:hypothetical protein L873DRAFT_1829740 [Choiromyces venosus 120613-1]|uniref:Snf7-domain-containing protein n=1 Tax=Choiromyces venosus 120613-1 TaxID=1336337 RepID=A0A3N4JEP2_9PEZI|nr:hypothetical protein L873DRAFT_1829740 [Choiromyces venosus 120613-1]
MSDVFRFILTHEQSRSLSGIPASVTPQESAFSQAAANGVLGGDALVSGIGEGLVSSSATREGVRPLVLGTVAVTSLETFLGMRESVYYRPWVDPCKVLGWGLEVAGLKSGAVGDGKIRQRKVVVLKNIEFSIHRRQLSERYLQVLLAFLSRYMREASIANNTIKFKHPMGEQMPISPHDTTIANLKTLITSLQTAITTFFTKISTSDAKAPTAIQSSTKHVALSALKSKKILETSLESQAKSLAQLEEVLVKIEQAGDNIELVRMREHSSKVLARLNKRVGGTEDVGKVADALQEHMEEAGEVTRISGGETDATAHVDDGEVEGEFEALL